MSYTSDHYQQKAHQQGLRARSYFKLEEIDKKHHIIQKKQHILDLGCAPGSWSLYCLKSHPSIKVTGVDLQSIEPIQNNNFTFMQADVFNLTETDFSTKFDLIISDMAPKTTGTASVDSSMSAELVEKAFYLSNELLQEKGAFVAKYLQGADMQELRSLLMQSFKTVKIQKPKSSRKNSTEIFFICQK